MQDRQSPAGKKVIYIQLRRNFRNNVVESHGRAIPFNHENTSRMALDEKEAYDCLQQIEDPLCDQRISCRVQKTNLSIFQCQNVTSIICPYRVKTKPIVVFVLCCLPSIFTFFNQSFYRYNEVCKPGYNFGISGGQRGTGHFTQVVWKASTMLGYGKAEGRRRRMQCTYVVGRYKPQGNFDTGNQDYEKNVLQGSFQRSYCNTISNNPFWDTDVKVL